MTESPETTTGTSQPCEGRLDLRTVIALIAAIAFVIGCLPTAAFLGYAVAVLPLAFVVFIGACWTAWRGIPASCTQPPLDAPYPSFAELALAVVGQSFLASIVAVMALLVWALLYGIAALLHLLPSWFPGSTINPALVAQISGFVSLFLWALAYAPLAIKELRASLWPETAHVRSAYYSIAADLRLSIVTGLICLSLAILGVIGLDAFNIHNGWHFVALQLVVLSSALPTRPPARRQSNLDSGPQIEEAAARVFHALEYYVISNPSSASTVDLGPLLTGVDLIIERRDRDRIRAFAIQIKTAQSRLSYRVELMDVSNLETTARSLGDYRERLGLKADWLSPLVIYLGVPAYPSVRKFAEQQGIFLLELDLDFVVGFQSSDLRKIDMAREALSPLDRDIVLPSIVPETELPPAT